MKRILFALMFCAVPLFGQYVDRIDTVTTLPAMADPLDHVVFQSKVYIWANGGWRIARQQLSGLIRVDTLGGEAVVDSTVWAKKYLLDGKQNAGVYLVPGDTNSLASRLAGKQTIGTYLVPSDTNTLASRLAGKQTVGTYLVPSDTNTLASRLAGKQPTGTYLVPNDTAALRNGLNGKEPTISAGTTAQYWRGDKTWQTLPSGGDPWTRITRSSDTTKGNGSPFVDIGQLEFVMDAGGFYQIEADLFIQRATAANGWTLAMNFSQAPTRTAIWGIGHNAAATQTINLIDTYLDSLAMTGTTVTTGDAPVTLRGWILNTGSATNFKMRWRGELATNITLLRGSELRYIKKY